MRDGKDGKDDAASEILISRLVKEVGISRAQARELIELIGTDWASLLREARFLKDRH
ncbi:hypothetical protein [Mesorhizobium argentiipisi]|uniref:DUF3606 domain-containing protein n=1 Tax=Mesorhizobium argentiipisi TaxID=3015175 RepID=A0ABU8KEL6_9HYPH